MKNKLTKLRLIFLLKKDDTLIVPTDDSCYPKEFLFRMENDHLHKLKQMDGDFKMSLFEDFLNSHLLYEFIIQLFPKGYETYLAEIAFEFDGQTYEFSYMAEEWVNNYSFIYDPFIHLGEEFGRVEFDMYKFDDYVYEYGMDESNLEYNLFGKKSEGGWYGGYTLQR